MGIRTINTHVGIQTNDTGISWGIMILMMRLINDDGIFMNHRILQISKELMKLSGLYSGPGYIGCHRILNSFAMFCI